MLGRGLALRVGVVVIALSALVLSTTASGAPTAPSAVAREYAEAAQASGVPAPLLAAIGYVNTRWAMPRRASPDGGRGPMHLDGGRLRAAARLTGIPVRRLAHDPGSNLRGGAALLRRLAGRHRPATLGEWFKVVARLYGRDAAGQVYATLSHGARTRVDGETVSLSPRTISVPRSVAASGAGRAEYPAALWRPASRANFTPANRPASSPILRIVIHTTEGSYGGTIHWFQNPAAHASAHYVVRSSDGQVTQMVAEKDEAWHAGNGYYNATAIGIEHEAYVGNCAWYTDAMYRGSARLVAYLALKYAIPIDRAHIIGHHQVPDPNNPRLHGGAGHHTDPGPCWDWTKYMALVREYAGRSDEAIVDNRGRRFSAPGWRVVSQSPQRYGPNYAVARPSQTGAAATFRVDVPAAGDYALYGWWPASNDANAAVPVDVETASGTQRALVDQRANGRAWVFLGSFTLRPGLRAIRFSRRTTTPGRIAADAVKIEPVRPVAASALSASTAGWALTPRRLSATGDGGESWHSIEPPGVAATAIRAIDFLDAVRGWAVALSAGNARPALLATRDGGVTWTQSDIPAPPDLDAGGPITVDFTDDADGFVSVRRQARGVGAGLLLRTLDGGRTWRSSRLPVPGAIRFPTATDGWLSSPDAGRLYVTHNGGGSWRAVRLPRPASYRGSIAVPGLPSFVDPESAVLPVTLAGKHSAVEFLASEDGGRSWRVAATVPTVRPLTRARLLPAVVIDAGTWLAALEGGRRFVVVGDSGTPPARVIPRSLPFGGSKPPVSQLHFASPADGWAQVDSLCPLFHRPRCAGTQALYATSDGGATWRRLSPP